jgi:AcrR family transcriptional regulator
MPRSSAKLRESRRQEIVSACEELYKDKGFNEITLLDISHATILTRTALYKYYQTKEEIFLDLLKLEHERWSEALTHILNDNKVLSEEEFVVQIAKTLDDRLQLLRLMAMNVFELEAKSRYERVVEFKISMGKPMKLIRDILDKFITDMSDEQKEQFVYAFFPLIFGIYPYSVINERSFQAMEEAGIEFHYYTVYELCCNGIRALLHR